MRLLVGTLRTIENEFDDCCQSIRTQTYSDYEHLVIENLGNREAHAKLFQTFMERRHEFELLVKIDADMVICRGDFFSRLVDRFRTEPKLSHLQVWVHDWFTDRLISGMNIYRNTVTFDVGESNVFVEGHSIRNSSGLRQTDKSELAPAAVHCPNPLPFQAFHFGMHKGVKVRAALKSGEERRAAEHVENVESLWEHRRKVRDVRLSLACLAAELALNGTFEPPHLDYSHPFSKAVFSRFACESDHIVYRRACRSRWMCAGFLRGAQRFEWIRDGGLRFLARRLSHTRLASWSKRKALGQ